MKHMEHAWAVCSCLQDMQKVSTGWVAVVDRQYFQDHRLLNRCHSQYSQHHRSLDWLTVHIYIRNLFRNRLDLRFILQGPFPDIYLIYDPYYRGHFQKSNWLMTQMLMTLSRNWLDLQPKLWAPFSGTELTDDPHKGLFQKLNWLTIQRHTLFQEI